MYWYFCRFFYSRALIPFYKLLLTPLKPKLVNFSIFSEQNWKCCFYLTSKQIDWNFKDWLLYNRLVKGLKSGIANAVFCKGKKKEKMNESTLCKNVSTDPFFTRQLQYECGLLFDITRHPKYLLRSLNFKLSFIIDRY